MGLGLPGQPVAGICTVGPAAAQGLLLKAEWTVVPNGAEETEHDGDRNKEFSPTKRRQIKANLKTRKMSV
jgi:hypothetical protein